MYSLHCFNACFMDQLLSLFCCLFYCAVSFSGYVACNRMTGIEGFETDLGGRDSGLVEVLSSHFLGGTR
jgi:hypothetical protein